jgi:RNA polymerase sigma factor (sigma-70 family)
MSSTEMTPEELEAHLERLHEASFGWALSCCGWNEADAEDVLQSTYMKVIAGRARFDGRAAFRTWLFGVIRLTAFEHRRRAASHAARPQRLGARLVASGEHVAHPEDPVERSERSAVLLEALQTLPDKQRQVLHLVFYQDLTVAEAAEVMEVSLGTARVHYDRGKKKLRALLSSQETGGGTP